jgi:hypothetical protein
MSGFQTRLPRKFRKSYKRKERKTTRQMLSPLSLPFCILCAVFAFVVV